MRFPLSPLAAERIAPDAGRPALGTAELSAAKKRPVRSRVKAACAAAAAAATGEAPP